MSKRVAIATPSSLIALLWAVANGWERQRLAENAEEIRKAGVEMHNRLQVFMGHYKRAGDQLRRAAQSFNDSIGSFDRNVMRQARRFEELPGVSPNQTHFLSTLRLKSVNPRTALAKTPPPKTRTRPPSRRATLLVAWLR